MKAQDIMVNPVYKVKDTDTVREVVEQFITHRISGVPVVNDRNEVVAYISDGDIMRYIGKHKDFVVDSLYYAAFFKGDDVGFEERAQKLLGVKVMNLATKRVVHVSADEEVENIAAILGKKQFKKLPVLRGGVLVGIVSRGDIVRHAFKSIL